VEDKVTAGELDLLRESIAAGTPVVMVKEALGVLGRIRDPRAEKALVERVKAFERSLREGGDALYGEEETSEMLDRACEALALQGTRNAFRTVARHAFSEDPALGDAMGRIEQLGNRDLTIDPEQLAGLVQSLQNLLPSKVLGFVVGKNSKDIIHIIRALSGTPAPAVKRALEEIAAKYRGQDFADAARDVLEKFEKAAPAAAEAAETLSGDLELFGLPELFQSLVSSNVRGTLVLSDRKGRSRASMFIAGGTVRNCETGRLRGIDAFYQLFEKPVSGTFTFTDASTSGMPAEGTADDAIEVLPTVLDAMRRHDEFQMSRAMVPDGTLLEPGARKPTPPPDETDLSLVREVWEKASGGMAPETCETAVLTDSFRIRRLYSHWVEQGALRQKAASAP
jgi:hypothetical protein